jgi:hypothetical protein
MCLVLATLYVEAVEVLEEVFRQGFSMDPRYVTALVELRRVLLVWPDVGHTMDPEGLVDVSDHLIRFRIGPTKDRSPPQRVS